jgi:hypothetical protein
MQQLGAAARFGPVGEIIRLQTTFTYSDPGMAEVCSHDGGTMKNRGESVEAALVETRTSRVEIARAGARLGARAPYAARTREFR